MEYRLHNLTKGRKATANETAKHLINKMLQDVCDLHSKWSCEGLTDDEIQEVGKFFYKHADAIKKRLDNGDQLRVINDRSEYL